MSHRKIIIKSCADCPHRGHKGAFGRVAYVPLCRKKDLDLPHTLIVARPGWFAAVQTEGIPNWCPLAKEPVCR